MKYIQHACTDQQVLDDVAQLRAQGSTVLGILPTRLLPIGRMEMPGHQVDPGEPTSGGI